MLGDYFNFSIVSISALAWSNLSLLLQITLLSANTYFELTSIAFQIYPKAPCERSFSYFISLFRMRYIFGVSVVSFFLLKMLSKSSIMIDIRLEYQLITIFFVKLYLSDGKLATRILLVCELWRSLSQL